MTVKIAYVKANGEVASIQEDYSKTPLSSGTTQGIYTLIHLPADSNNRDFLTKKYYKDSEWHTRDAAPNQFYEWKNYTWVLQEAEVTEELRGTRDFLLTESDWTQLPDVALSTDKKAEWATYRQKLRDFSFDLSSFTTFENVVWPTKPS